ncbi:hypothetical protein OIO90_001266 [Microbotryomycetes sp. JL221]|nr:hypothetical protein OIO90_001266 [Microbotryomycetes sp. JL221]
MNYIRALVNSFMPRATSPEDVAKARELVEDMIASNRVAVFSKSYCPYCRDAKSILRQQVASPDSDLSVIELDHRSDGAAIQQYLADRVNQSRVTVPQIYIGKELVGDGVAMALPRPSQDAIIVNTVICALSFLGGAGIITGYFCSTAVGTNRLRQRVVLGLGVADCIQAAVILVASAIHLAGGQFSTNSPGCNSTSFLYQTTTVVNACWTATIAFITYTTLVHPLSRMTAVFEHRIAVYILWAVVWLFGLIPAIFGVIFFDSVDTNGGVCWYQNGSLQSKLMIFVPRAVALLTVIVLYGLLLTFLYRRDLSLLATSSDSAADHDLDDDVGGRRMSLVRVGERFNAWRRRSSTTHIESMHNGISVHHDHHVHHSKPGPLSPNPNAPAHFTSSVNATAESETTVAKTDQQAIISVDDDVVSVGRLISQLITDKPAHPALTNISRWLVFGQGFVDGVLYFRSEYVMPRPSSQANVTQADDKSRSPGMTALHVSELHWWTSDKHLSDLCKSLGFKISLEDVHFSEHKVNGKSKGEFQGKEMSARLAIATLGRNPFATLPKGEREPASRDTKSTSRVVSGPASFGRGGGTGSGVRSSGAQSQGLTTSYAQDIVDSGRMPGQYFSEPGFGYGGHLPASAISLPPHLTTAFMGGGPGPVSFYEPSSAAHYHA